jgi:curli biogenesis system outer membrane secretion channel CsgG
LKIENRTSEFIDSEALTELLQVEFVKQKYYIVVERNQLQKILEEKKLSLLSGLTETEQAVKLWELLGAQKIWMGSLY